MAKVVALTHIECEGPGWWGEFLEERGIGVDRVRLEKGESLPDFGTYEAVFVLGGPMNVDEDDRYAWLRPEKAAIRRIVESGQPIIGLCLGSQLLARALGAEVAKNPVKEIGWSLVTLTHEGQDDPLFAGVGSLLPVFHWHGDTFALPEGATLLATSTLCAHQAFRVGKCAYGLQFHVEVTPAMLPEWVRAYRREVEAELPPGAGQRMIEQARTAAASAEALSRRMCENFCEIAGLPS